MPLIEQEIPTLFNGVSRQPASVRLLSQVQEADNVYPSVASGGLERRPATQSIAELVSLDTAEDFSVFAIDRDSEEKYIVVVGDDELFVFDAFTGDEKTVNLNDASIPDYLVGADTSFRFTAVADYSFLANTEVQVFMDDEPFGRSITPVAVSSITWNAPSATELHIVLNATANGLGIGDWFKITADPNSITPTALDGLWCRVAVDNSANQVTAIMHDQDAAPSTITQVLYDGAVAENAPLVRFDISDFTTANGASGTVTSAGTVAYLATKGRVDGKRNSFAALPATPTNLHIYRITPAPDEDATAYFVQYDSADDVWNECPRPGDQYKLDYTSMPIKMIRDADGSFEVSLWGDSVSGFDEEARGAAPPPPFVGRTLEDIFYARNRLGFLADESLYTSRNGDVFQLFPEKASLVLATDPVDLTASTQQVTVLRWALPFRQEIFLTSDAAQFEASGELFTVDDARLDPSTQYQVDIDCRPAIMAEQLFFPAKSDGAGAIYEYYLDTDTNTNTASSITKHADGYLPPGCRQLATAALPERVFVLPATQRNHIFAYTNYWNGQEKVQSAWTRLVFGADEDEAFIHGIQVLGNFLYLVVRRVGGVFLERMPTDAEALPSGLGFAPCLDRRAYVTGSFNAMTGNTTWTVPYQHDDNVIVVLGEEWPEEDRAYLPAVDYPSATTVRASGDFSDHPAYLGVPYLSLIELSKQFPRNQNGAAVTSGRNIMRSMQLNYRKSGYFDVTVTPPGRSSKTYSFTGRNLGDPENVVGEGVVIDEGSFRFRVGGKADKTSIVVSSSSHLPFTITGGSWIAANIPAIKDQQAQ